MDIEADAGIHEASVSEQSDEEEAEVTVTLGGATDAVDLEAADDAEVVEITVKVKLCRMLNVCFSILTGCANETPPVGYL